MTATAQRPKPSARNVAFAVIRDVFGPQQRGAAESLDHHLRRAGLDARDRAFVTELAYGTIERRRWLDWQLAPYLGGRNGPLPAMIGEILRLGTYQLRVMRVHDYAAVSESVQLARRFGHKGTAGLVNAVLRRVAGDPERPVPDDAFPDPDDVLGTRWSLPTWLVRQWRARFGPTRLEAILAGIDEPAAVAVVVDRRRSTPDELIAALAAAGIAAHRSPLVPAAVVLDGAAPTEALPAAIGGRGWLQAEAAAIPVDLLAAGAGEAILDACSGRGNKTMQIAAALDGTGRITAIDTDARKMAALAERIGTAAELRIADATQLDPAERFDAALVDAPCSATGILGRQPEARWRKQPEDAERLAPLQTALLASAAASVRPGGRLVYAVCSTDPREAEGIVEPFLAAQPAWSRAPLPARYAELATPGGDVLVPPGIAGRDGFFVATLRHA